MIYDDYFFRTIHALVLFVKIQSSINSYRFERQIGSKLVLPPCLSTVLTSAKDVAVRETFLTFLFFDQ